MKTGTEPVIVVTDANNDVVAVYPGGQVQMDVPPPGFTISSAEKSDHYGEGYTVALKEQPLS